MILATAALAVLATNGDVEKVLAAADAEVRRGVKYDLSQRYRILTFKGGVDTKSHVFPLGDLDPGEGVCTDVVVRAFRAADVDFQRLVRDDIARAPKAFPLKAWNQRRPDPNIDHRRVPNLLAYLRRHARLVATDADLRPGDIVVWDLASRGWPDHIGIVSARRSPEGGRYLIVHNYPDPGHVAYADVLTRWLVVARFRFFPPVKSSHAAESPRASP